MSELSFGAVFEAVEKGLEAAAAAREQDGVVIVCRCGLRPAAKGSIACPGCGKAIKNAEEGKA